MIKQYNYDYNSGEAEVTFKVDTDVLTEENAKLMLEFFTWEYDKEANPVDELLKKYAIAAIEVATAENYNENGVKDWFEESEGYLPLDGSQGIELTYVSEYNFEEDWLSITITDANP